MKRQIVKSQPKKSEESTFRIDFGDLMFIIAFLLLITVFVMEYYIMSNKDIDYSIIKEINTIQIDKTIIRQSGKYFNYNKKYFDTIVNYTKHDGTFGLISQKYYTFEEAIQTKQKILEFFK